MIVFTVFQSIFLLDRQRLSVLYMGSGKTTNKIPKLDRLLSDCQVLTCSSNGTV